MKNKWILVLLILMISALLVTPLFAKPKAARPWDETSQDDDIWSSFGVYNKISKSDISKFLDEYDDFVQEAKEAYNDKDVNTLRRLKKESNDYEDKFFIYKKSNNWTSTDTNTFVNQTKTLEKYLLNRFYEKTTSSGKTGTKTPPTKR